MPPQVQRKPDPQHVVQGRFREGKKTDYITFRLIIYMVELVFIVTIPEAGNQWSPVYVKFKLRNGSNGQTNDTGEWLHEDELDP